MINHTPDVKEKLQKLGLVVLTEQSSSEPEALGRVEWIKLFGVLFDKEDEAAHLFNEQKARVEQTSGLASSGKTVAYFYINSNGAGRHAAGGRLRGADDRACRRQLCAR